MQKIKETIFLNGKFLSQLEAKTSILDPGFLHGFGLFETMRAYKNKIVYLHEHLQRIKDSSKVMGMRFPYSITQLKKIIRKTAGLNRFKDAYVRLTLWKAEQGTGASIIVKKYQPYTPRQYRKGFSAGISRFRQDEHSFLARIKSTSRLLYELSLQEAKGKGFDEAIILNSRGYITEGARSNLFLVKDNEIFTPSLECGCLGGITRRVVFGLAKKYSIKIYEGNFTAGDLNRADEAFLTNSLMGIMPLTSLERKIIGQHKCAKLTKFFTEKYRCLLK
jgi:branched-chain amino acid aminotransferase